MTPTRIWKTLSSKIVYSNPWIKIHEDQVFRPDGQKGIYGYLEKTPGIVVIAQDSDGSIYFVHEFRYPVQQTLLQLPMGVIERPSALAQAKKELAEETGIVAQKWQKIGRFYLAAGHETCYMEAFLATGLNTSRVVTQNQEGDEAIQGITKIPPLKLKRLIRQGQIRCGVTLSALTLFLSLR
jgi:8-oxo-dGTP pyrophosphatase MutT (NUDIX family)